MSIQSTFASTFDTTNEDGRAAARADLNKRKQTVLSNCTPIYASIKKSSKYFGQTSPGALFPVSIGGHGDYVVHGTQNDYRLRDVWLWVLDTETDLKIRLN